MKAGLHIPVQRGFPGDGFTSRPPHHRASICTRDTTSLNDSPQMFVIAFKSLHLSDRTTTSSASTRFYKTYEIDLGEGGAVHAEGI